MEVLLFILCPYKQNVQWRRFFTERRRRRGFLRYTKIRGERSSKSVLQGIRNGYAVKLGGDHNVDFIENTVEEAAAGVMLAVVAADKILGKAARNDKGTLDNLDHLAKCNLIGGTGKLISPVRALIRDNNASGNQLPENFQGEALGNLHQLGYGFGIGYGVLIGKATHDAKRVIGFHIDFHVTSFFGI